MINSSVSQELRIWNSNISEKIRKIKIVTGNLLYDLESYFYEKIVKEILWCECVLPVSDEDLTGFGDSYSRGLAEVGLVRPRFEPHNYRIFCEN